MALAHAIALPCRSATAPVPSPTEVGSGSRGLATVSRSPRLPAPATEVVDPCQQRVPPPAPKLAGRLGRLASAVVSRSLRTLRAVGLASIPRPGRLSARVSEPRPRQSQHLAHFMRETLAGRSPSRTLHTVVRAIGQRSDSRPAAPAPRCGCCLQRAVSPVLRPRRPSGSRPRSRSSWYASACGRRSLRRRSSAQCLAGPPKCAVASRLLWTAGSATSTAATHRRVEAEACSLR